VAPPALAHPDLRRSSPAANDTLQTAPSEIRLVFGEPIEARFSNLELRGPAGTRIPLDSVHVARGLELVGTPGFDLAPGKYEIRWQVAGADGHPIRGSIEFAVAATAAERPGAADRSPEHHPPEAFPEQGTEFGVQSPGFVAIRWLTFIGLLTLFGVIGFTGFVLRTAIRRLGPDADEFARLARRRALGIGLVASLMLMLAAPLRLGAQAFAARRPGERLSLDLLQSLVQTGWGFGWLMQSAGALLALFGIRTALRGRAAAWYWIALATVALAFSPGFSGHAAATGLFPLTLLTDAAHILSAGGWLGTLLVMLGAGLSASAVLPPDQRSGAVAGLVTAFSPFALSCAAVTAATGLFAAWVHLQTLPALWESPYGRILMLKLGVLSIVAATGAYNWRVLKPQLDDPGAIPRLRVSAGVELAVAVVVIAITAVLVATPPPGTGP
jgi:copper transport protein